MGVNYEKGKFTPASHSMMAAQVTRLVCELETGDFAYVRDEAAWVDRTPDRALWVNGYAEAFDDNTVIARGNSDIDAYARIFCVKEGLVLDRSHQNKRTWNWTEGLYLRDSLWNDPDVMPMRIIYCAFNADELQLVKKPLKKNGINLKKLIELPALLAAIDEAVELEDISSNQDSDEPEET